MNYTAWKQQLSKPEVLAILSEGTIVTPFELIEEIVDKLPIQWDNPNMKFLDPACGRGSFLFVIKHRLMQHHSEQHIVENMLFGMDISEQNVAFAKAVLNSENKYKDNVECGNSLEKEWNMNMKFDVTVMNPPFNDDQTTKQIVQGEHIKGRPNASQPLHLAFIEKMLTVSKNVAVICPIAKWFDPASKSKLYKQLFTKGLRLVDWRPDDVFSTVIVKGGLGIFIFDTSTPSNKVDVYQNNLLVKHAVTLSELSFQRSTIDEYRQFISSRETLGSLITSQTSRMSRTDLKGRIISTRSDTHQFRCLETTSVSGFVQLSDQQTDKTIGNIRVAFNHNAPSMTNMGKFQIVGPDDMLCYSVDCLICETQKEAEDIVRYLCSSEVKKLQPLIRTSNTNAKKYFDLIPHPYDTEAVQALGRLVNENTTT